MRELTKHELTIVEILIVSRSIVPEHYSIREEQAGRPGKSV
jgi:hypothetical protein